MASSASDFTVKSVSELKTVVQFLKSNFSGKDILLLHGPMGVGKTELVRAIVSDLHGEAITSPSFSIHNNYLAEGLSIDHLDLYRIEGDDDLESTGFWDLFNQQTGLIILEWADKLDKKLLPREWKQIAVFLNFNPDDSRQLSVKLP